jgi:hypothetical protein
VVANKPVAVVQDNVVLFSIAQWLVDIHEGFVKSVVIVKSHYEAIQRWIYVALLEDEDAFSVGCDGKMSHFVILTDLKSVLFGCCLYQISNVFVNMMSDAILTFILSYMKHFRDRKLHMVHVTIC